MISNTASLALMWPLTTCAQASDTPAGDITTCSRDTAASVLDSRHLGQLPGAQVLHLWNPQNLASSTALLGPADPLARREDHNPPSPPCPTSDSRAPSPELLL